MGCNMRVLFVGTVGGGVGGGGGWFTVDKLPLIDLRLDQKPPLPPPPPTYTFFASPAKFFTLD
jgi:hypothetical protein